MCFEHIDILLSVNAGKSVVPTDYKQSIGANQWCYAIANSYRQVKLNLIDNTEVILWLRWAWFMPSVLIQLPW